MPELPEVETIARSLAPHILGASFSRVRLLRSSCLHPLSLPLESLPGARIRNVGRRGKLLMLELEGGPDWLIMHLRMTGRALARSSEAEPGPHTRCIFCLEGAEGGPCQLFFDDIRAFGKILVATPQILAKWPFWQELGPEPFDLDAPAFQARLAVSKLLKTALLDQKVIAGIGNIYADESLFEAGLAPERPAKSLDEAESARLLECVKAVLERAIAKKGSSIRDYRDADGNEGAFQKTFSVYGRGGKPCKKCGGLLKKTRIGGRASVFCPHCQK